MSISSFFAGLPAQLRRIVAVEELPPPPPPPSEAPALPASGGPRRLVKWLFEIEPLAVEPPRIRLMPPGGEEAGEPRRIGWLRALFAIERLPRLPEGPARRHGSYLRWLLWPERLGRPENPHQTDRSR